MTIEVSGLGKWFLTGRRRQRNRVDAVHDVSFTVEAGERVAYLGPNGAGKSTTIKMLTGVLHASAGEARVLGMVPWRQRRQLTRRIGTLFGQRSQLWFELTPRQSYRMLAAIHGLDPATEGSRVGALADLLEAGDLFDRPVRSLSLGQRMRCELAACLLHEPPCSSSTSPPSASTCSPGSASESCWCASTASGARPSSSRPTTSPTSRPWPSGPSS